MVFGAQLTSFATVAGFQGADGHQLFG